MYTSGENTEHSSNTHFVSWVCTVFGLPFGSMSHRGGRPRKGKAPIPSSNPTSVRATSSNNNDSDDNDNGPPSSISSSSSLAGSEDVRRCAHVDCPFIEMLESRPDIVEKFDLFLGPRHQAFVTLAVEDKNNPSSNNTPAGDNDNEKDDDPEYRDDEDDPNEKKNNLSQSSGPPPLGSSSSVSSSSSVKKKRKAHAKRSKQFVDVITVYSQSGPFQCSDVLPPPRVGKGRRSSPLCDSCQKLSTKLRGFHRSHDTSRYVKRMTAQRERADKQRAREETKAERQRKRLAEAERKRQSQANKAANLAMGIKRMSELTLAERKLLRHDCISLTKYIRNVDPTFGLSIEDIQPPINKQNDPNNPNGNGTPKKRPRNNTLHEHLYSIQNEEEDDPYESDVDIVLSDSEGNANPLMVSIEPTGLIEIDDTSAGGSNKRVRLEDQYSQVVEKGCLRVITEETTPTPDFSFVMNAIHQQCTPSPSICPQSTFDFHYPSMISLIRQCWRSVCEHQHEHYHPLPNHAEQELVSLGAHVFESILRSADAQRLKLPGTRQQGKSHPSVWPRVFVNALRTLSLPQSVINKAEERLRPPSEEQLSKVAQEEANAIAIIEAIEEQTSDKESSSAAEEEDEWKEKEQEKTTTGKDDQRNENKSSSEDSD